MKKENEKPTKEEEIDYISYICPVCKTIWDEMIEDCGHYAGTMIKVYRLAKGWSIRDLAKRLGYKSHSIITAWENGTRKPKLSSIKKLAAVFGVRDMRFFY